MIGSQQQPQQNNNIQNFILAILKSHSGTTPTSTSPSPTANMWQTSHSPSSTNQTSPFMAMPPPIIPPPPPPPQPPLPPPTASQSPGFINPMITAAQQFQLTANLLQNTPFFSQAYFNSQQRSFLPPPPPPAQPTPSANGYSKL